MRLFIIACLHLVLLTVATMVSAKIVFTSRRGGEPNFQLYVMEDYGSNVRQIEHSEFWDSDPVWFPNGRQILFERDFTNGQAKRIIHCRVTMTLTG